MARRTISIILPGDSIAEGGMSPAARMGFGPSTTISKVRAKKSVAAGYFAFNIDAASSKDSKYIPTMGVVADYDAASIKGLADGTAFSFWQDSSGEGNDGTAPSGATPVWEDAGANITGYPAVQFRAADEDRVALGDPLDFASGDPFSVAIAVDGFSSSNGPIIGGDSGSGTKCTRLGNQAGGFRIRDDLQDSARSSTAVGNGEIVTLTKSTSDAVLLWIDGTSESISGAPNNNISFDYLCAERKNDSWNTDSHSISRIIIADRVWSTSQRQKIEGWLAHSMGIESSLPTGHPYVSTDPRVSKSKAFTSDINLDSAIADTFTSWVTPSSGAISGSVDIFVAHAYKAGTITIELEITY
jgi:hypothetical protein